MAALRRFLTWLLVDMWVVFHWQRGGDVSSMVPRDRVAIRVEAVAAGAWHSRALSTDGGDLWPKRTCRGFTSTRASRTSRMRSPMRQKNTPGQWEGARRASKQAHSNSPQGCSTGGGKSARRKAPTRRAKRPNEKRPRASEAARREVHTRARTKLEKCAG